MKYPEKLKMAMNHRLLAAQYSLDFISGRSRSRMLTTPTHVYPQVALAALLEEKAFTESRASELEKQLEHASKALREAEARADALTTDLQETRQEKTCGTIQFLAPTTSAVTGAQCGPAISQPSEASATTATEMSERLPSVHSAPSATPADEKGECVQQHSTALVDTAAAASVRAAEARATKTEAALNEALEAVEELEARCASAQARQREIERELGATIEAMGGKLEEANSNGPKASSIHCCGHELRQGVFT